MKILHTADTHLMERQYGRSYRGEDFRRALHQVVDIAIEQKIDLIINSGDTFQFKRPGTRLQAVLLEIHGRLKTAGIPMYSVTGNHDASDPSLLEFPALQDWYGNLSKMPEVNAIETFRRERRLEKMTGIVCIDNARVTLPNGMVLAGFPAAVDNEMMLKELNERPADIVCWHGAVEEFVPFAMANSLTLADLDIAGVKAWLLGDIHLPGSMRTPVHGCLVSYPGPIEMCEKGEEADKKVDLYEPTDAGVFSPPTFVPLKTRPALFLTVADQAQADQACDQIALKLKEHPDGILIYMSYDRNHRDIVKRVNTLIDPRKTVFLAATYQSKHQSRLGKSKTDGRPELAEIVAEVVPNQSRLNQICLSLAQRGNATRLLLTEWVDERLRDLKIEDTSEKETTLPAPPLNVEEPKPLF